MSFLRKLCIFLIMAMIVFAPSSNAQEITENGLHKEYYPNGSLKATAYYYNGKPHGYMREYYENGKMESSTRYENGIRYGDYFSYYENGMVKERKLFNQKGELGSDAYMYLEDGTLISDVEYRDGKLTGRKREYYPNGVIKLAVKCNNYEVICTFVEYRDDGNPIQEYKITNGAVDESSRIVYPRY